MNRKPKYTYERDRHLFVVRSWRYTGNGAVGTKLAEFWTREEARAEVYRLNGWKLTIKNQ